MIDWHSLKLPPINLWSLSNMGIKQKQLDNFIDPRSTSSGSKHDQDKLRMDLLDPWALEGLASVLTFGANKYEAHNWRKGIVYSRLVAAMERHLGAIKKGEYIDGESGLPHIDHLGCNWMFLSNFMKTHPDLDDLWKAENSFERLRNRGI